VDADESANAVILQSVALAISARVAPSLRFINSRTFSALLPDRVLFALSASDDTFITPVWMECEAEDKEKRSIWKGVDDSAKSVTRRL